MSRNRRRQDDEETTYWLSYSDMMAALLLIFVLIISFTMLQAKKEYETKEAELIRQQKIVEQQQSLLAEQQQTMNEQQEKIDQIIGVRADLVSALKDEFSGSDLKVSVDAQTGSITLDSSIMFDNGSSKLKTSGEEFLKEFIPRYIGVLLKPDFKDYVSEIIIEGHTDTRSGYIYNLGLSQDRALSVTKYVLQEDNTSLTVSQTEELRNILTANGRSYSDPIYEDDGVTVDMAASRRVEFKFRLKDEEMVNEMKNILSQNDEE